MVVPTKYYETDLVSTEDIFDVISLADYLILESLYKVEFYTFTLQMKDVAEEPPRLSVDKELERIIKKITTTESYNNIFNNLYNFVRQDYDNNYQKFLSELLFGRYGMLTLSNIINTSANFEDSDIEGNVVSCKLNEPEGRRYFHMVHGHVKFMETKERIEKEKNQSFKAMMDGILGATSMKPPSIDIFAIPPPSAEDQKMVQDMFRKMMEESMKHRDNQIKKNLEYDQLKKNKSIFDDDNIDDFLDENDEYDTFDMDDDEVQGK